MMHPIFIPVLLLLASALWYLASTSIKTARLQTIVMASGTVSFVLGLVMLVFYGSLGLMMALGAQLS